MPFPSKALDYVHVTREYLSQRGISWTVCETDGEPGNSYLEALVTFPNLPSHFFRTRDLKEKLSETLAKFLFQNHRSHLRQMYTQHSGHEPAGFGIQIRFVDVVSVEILPNNMVRVDFYQNGKVCRWTFRGDAGQNFASEYVSWYSIYAAD